MSDLSEYTHNPLERNLPQLLCALHACPDVLVVLNHPMWDLAGIGPERHARTLRTLLCRHGQFLHALELSGIRSWPENQAVVHLSDGCNQTLISGGDRHGCEPNAALNLTNAESFTEFVHQVRKERSSHVLFMPQYTEPLTLRILQTLLDLIREYPDYSSGSRQWDERVFHPDHTGAVRPLSALWEKPPYYVRHFFSVADYWSRPRCEGRCDWRSPGRNQKLVLCMENARRLCHDSDRPARRFFRGCLQRSRWRGQHRAPIRIFCVAP
jgi:hypothetical protein